MRIIKFLLYISKDEQARRFRERLDDKSKNWKFSLADVKEREYWDQYIEAYEEMLRKCSTEDAPWYVIPANKKWFRNLAVSRNHAAHAGEHGPEISQAGGGLERHYVRVRRGVISSTNRAAL